MNLSELFDVVSPSVVAFISKVARGRVGTPPPLLPTIIGTGFLVNSDGLAVTNRHVVKIFDNIPKGPKGESGLSAILSLRAGEHWQLLFVDVLGWFVLSEFKSPEPDKWYGQEVPDIGFVQLQVREVPVLKLATDDFYLKIGMDIATVSYPLGTLPLTALGKINQITPFLRQGIVSSVFPFPTAIPNGFTIDVMQQGGSSGSPIFETDEAKVIGMMSSSVLDWNIAKSESVTLAYSQNTNISIAEPAHIIQLALESLRTENPFKIDSEKVPTLDALRKKSYEDPANDAPAWTSWIPNK